MNKQPILMLVHKQNESAIVDMYMQNICEYAEEQTHNTDVGKCKQSNMSIIIKRRLNGACVTAAEYDIIIVGAP